LDIIKDNVNDKTFGTWFAPIVPVKYNDSDFTIQVPSQFFYEYIEEQFADLIHATLYRVTGKNLVLYYRVVVDPSNKKGGLTTRQSEGATKAEPAVQETKIGLTPPAAEWKSNLNPRFNFDNFYESQSNLLARRVGETIAKEPGKTFNPLYIYGGSGVGKTHLCHAIGNKITELYPDKKVVYISSHLFQVQFTDSSRNNTSNDFINFYQGVDVLIVDDIQELAGKEKTQNVYFHIFNHLHLLGKQIILTSDKAPIELKGLEERLITRFKWGMPAEMQKPDFELRRKILENKAVKENVKLTGEMLDYIAENVKDSIRDLEGIVTSLLAHSLAYKHNIDFSLVERVVKKFVKSESKQITIEKIQDTVCNYFNLDLKDVNSKSRKREIVLARQISMFLSKKHTDFSFSHIGSIIGKRDHATVLYTVRLITDYLKFNKTIRNQVLEIENILLHS
jgi:chromosomal replication initiator protein